MQFPDESPVELPAPPAMPRREGAVGTLLRIPLYYKILIANAIIVVLGAIAGTMATVEYLRAEPGQSPVWLVSVLAIVGVVASVLVNAYILRLALSPLRLLEQTAARVQDGDVDARAPRSPISDAELDRLTRTFNGMLNTLAAYRQRLREVAARALNAEEEERKRIARELHDETAQTLAALLIRLRLARSVDDAAARSDLLDEMRREVGAALEGVRRFARGLRPPALEELGLVVALESHGRGITESVGLQVRVDADPLDGLLSSTAELAVYRIVQEALSNVIRHSGATASTVRLVHRDGELVATVEDNGSGFPVADTMRAGSGLGLFGMQERAAYIGGRIDVQSRPVGGTRVVAVVPLGKSPLRVGFAASA